jgi:peptidoglycan hydrolase CwlO-like protein
MHSSRILNLNPTPSEPVNPDAPRSEENVAQMNDSIEQTRADVRRMRTQLEHQEDEHESHARKTKILSAILAFLVVTLAGAAWFAYPTLRDQKKTTLDMLGAAGALGEHVQSLESKFDKTSADVPALSARMDQLGANMKTSLQAARAQAQAAAAQAGQRIKADLNESIQAIQSRLAGLESNQKETSGHVNQLEEQIAGLKREIATMRQQSSTATDKMTAIQQEQQARAGDLARLDQKVVSNQTALDSISSRVERKRVEFQLPNRKAEQVAPGIFLAIRRADTKKQEVDGTLQLGGDSRMLTIRGQGIQKPLSFYTSAETRPFELVFTEVSRTGVSGYVLTPATEVASTEAAKAQ